MLSGSQRYSAEFLCKGPWHIPCVFILGKHTVLSLEEKKSKKQLIMNGPNERINRIIMSTANEDCHHEELAMASYRENKDKVHEILQSDTSLICSLIS